MEQVPYISHASHPMERMPAYGKPNEARGHFQPAPQQYQQAPQQYQQISQQYQQFPQQYQQVPQQYQEVPQQYQQIPQQYQQIPQQSQEVPQQHLLVAGPDQSKSVLRFWIWELAALVIATGLIAAIYGIIAHYNGQPVPQWPLSINLSTLVSLLATLFRMATLAAVAEVISQLKWSWFSQTRPVLDLDRLDRASRGALGSLQLIFRLPRNFIALAGAVVTIISLAIGAFTQQAIRTVSCAQPVGGTNASIPVANYLEGQFSRIGADLYEPMADMKGVIINGLTNPLGNDTAASAFCPTGNCTFADYDGVTHSSICLCSTCIDTSSQISSKSIDGEVVNFTLPNGFWVANGETSNIYVGPDSLSWASGLFTPDFSAANTQSLLSVSILTFTNTPCSTSPDYSGCANSIDALIGSDLRPLAVSCVLYPCLKNFYGVVIEGQLQETVVSTVPASISMELNPNGLPGLLLNYTALKTPCAVDGNVYDASNFSTLSGNHLFEVVTFDGQNVSAPYECLYKFGGIYARALNVFMSSTILNGFCAGNADSPEVLYCTTAFWLEPLFGGGAATLTSISDFMGNFTTVITTKIRKIGTSLYFNSDGTNLTGGDALGVVLNATVCTQFSWGWLILPTALLALAVLLLVYSIVKNYFEPRRPVWKSSLLPFLYYGFINPPATTSILNKDQLEELSGNTNAQLLTDETVGFMCT